MARVPLPESRVRARRRRRRKNAILLFLCVFALALAGVAALSHAQFLRISTVEVRGAQNIPAAALESIVREHLEGSVGYILARDNIFLYPKGQITAALRAAYPELKSADVHAQNFSTVAVEVAERTPKALWCPDAPEEPCLRMDDEGVVYAPGEGAYIHYSGKAEGPLPRQYLSAAEFRSLSALVDAIAQTHPEDELRAVAVDKEGDVRVRFKSGFVLMFALEDDGGDVFERFVLAQEAEPFAARALADFEYLDLRFGDKLYYKLKNE